MGLLLSQATVGKGFKKKKGCFDDKEYRPAKISLSIYMYDKGETVVLQKFPVMKAKEKKKHPKSTL